MKRKIALLAFGLVFGGQTAFAVTTDTVVADLQAEGYSRVDVKVGPTQMKVEAIRGTEKLEMVLDNNTGEVLRSDAGSVEAGDNTTPGVRVRDRNRDFVRASQGTDANDQSLDDGQERNRERDRNRNRERHQGDDSASDSHDGHDSNGHDSNGHDSNGHDSDGHDGDHGSDGGDGHDGDHGSDGNDD